jgi:AraC-like DNA-binding protein
MHFVNFDTTQIDAVSIGQLFSVFSDIYVFAKNCDGQFIGANSSQLKKLGLKSEGELVGKTDFDFFPNHMIASYTKDDDIVMQTRVPIRRRLEPVVGPDGSTSLYVTSKFPLMNRQDECVGIIGCMRDFEQDVAQWQPYRNMNTAVEYIQQHYKEPLEIAKLAQVSGLSVSQFGRRFRAVFQHTPIQFLLRYRLIRASEILIRSNLTVSHIAQQVGFYDHSHFSREFRRLFGLSPGVYRQQHTISSQ